ncbi:MAG: hypothetical protein HY272_03095 [Gammaproteobacteria bacterium]|nr:hypothetical protein [Gammaproteobacteria bacterium]
MKKLIGLVIVMFSVNSYAGSAASGTISSPSFFNDGQVVVYTNGARTGYPLSSPSCSGGNPSAFAFDGKTAEGKVLLAGLLSAYTTGKQVAIIGTGSCPVSFTNMEAISYFYITN